MYVSKKSTRNIAETRGIELIEIKLFVHTIYIEIEIVFDIFHAKYHYNETDISGTENIFHIKRVRAGLDIFY